MLFKHNAWPTSLDEVILTALVKCALPVQSLRRGSSVFAGKQGFITLRDLFRWADRYRLEEQTEASQDWLQHLADDGEARQTFSDKSRTDIYVPLKL